MSKLVLHLADGTMLNIPLDKERITIGRRADNDVCLPNLAVSGEHAAVVTILDDSFLEDLGSTNGTEVNRNAITKHFLRDRDEIDIGRHKLVYFDNDDETATSHYFARGMRAAAGDLGEQVQVAAAPMAKRISGGAQSQKSPESAVDDMSVTPGYVKGGAPAPSLSTQAAAAVAAPNPAPVRRLVKVLAGAQAGREIPLTQERTSIGRAGVQVALIVQAGDTFRLEAIEGERAPLVNGEQTTDRGIELVPGDVIEIAGSKVEFVDCA